MTPPEAEAETVLQLCLADTGGAVVVRPARLIVAGYTGRDRRAVQRHIDELERAGIAPPETVPMLYRLDAGLLTTDPEIVVDGRETSGEAEPVYLRADGKWYLGVGSDHTDRRLERLDVRRSKAACPKPLSPTVVRLTGDPTSGSHDAAWDRTPLRSEADGVACQAGTLAELLAPSQVLPLVLASLPPEEQDVDLVIFGGTVPLLSGEFSFARRWRVELRFEQQVIRHDYSLSPSAVGADDARQEERKAR